MNDSKRISPLLDHLGIELVSMDGGKATLTMPAVALLSNSGAMVHGGALMALADSAAAAASWTVVGADKMAVTTDFNLCCIRSVAIEDEARMIRAEAEMLHRGRRFMRSEVCLYDDEILVAKAGISFMVIDRPKAVAG